uniref:Uncharacterized protein n=1 Tax=Ciona savignyi TaxID=51511 RepID=H2ZJG4_CIOSA
MQALFLLEGSLLDGVSAEERKHMMEDASSSLDEQPELSSRAVIALAKCAVHLADLGLVSGQLSSIECISMYKNGHSVILLQALKGGETISHSKLGTELSTVQQPIKN